MINELMMSAEELRNHTRVMTLILEHARQGEAFTALAIDEKHLNQLKEAAFALLSTQNIRFSLDTIGDFLLRSGEKIEFKMAQEVADAVGFGTLEEFLKPTEYDNGQVNIVTNAGSEKTKSMLLNEFKENTSDILNPPVIKRRENPPFIVNTPEEVKRASEAQGFIKPMSLEDRQKVGLVKDTPPGILPNIEMAKTVDPVVVAPTPPPMESKPISDAIAAFTNDEEDDEESASPDQWGKGMRQDPNIEIENTGTQIKITRKK